MEGIEIFVLEMYNKTTKKKSYYYYSKLETAKRKGKTLLSCYKNIIVIIYPSHLITE